MINIQVAYAKKDKQRIIRLQVKDKTTVIEAIHQSKILEEFPEINLDKNKVGIYGELIELNEPVSEGDRIEIYDPLMIDPMQARRLRAQKNVKACK